jgi:hypothetical protein
MFRRNSGGKTMAFDGAEITKAFEVEMRAKQQIRPAGTPRGSGREHLDRRRRALADTSPATGRVRLGSKSR